jgi:DNA-binding winged helix-turn-helix (wHTH) protein
LVLLISRRGEVVTREELQRNLWPANTFVDFEHSVNTAVMRLRDTLGDPAESPRFIETVPRYGYRFIALVEWPAEIASPPVHVAQQESQAGEPKGRIRLPLYWAAGLTRDSIPSAQTSVISNCCDASDSTNRLVGPPPVEIPPESRQL